MIGWGLAFIEIDGKYYGCGTDCWISIEINMIKKESKFKKLYDKIVAGIMKYYNKGELRAISLTDVERFPADSTIILRDGKITYADREKRIRRVPTRLHWNPWAILYTDQGSTTMDLDELDEWAWFEYINDRAVEARHRQKLDIQNQKRMEKKAAQANG